MVETHRAFESDAVRRRIVCPNGFLRVHEAKKDVIVAGAKTLHENHGLIGLHPGVHRRRAFDGGGLVPCPLVDVRGAGVTARPVRTGGRDELDAILAHREILDQRLAVGVGVDLATAEDIIHGSAIHHERLASFIELIGRPQWIAEGVGQDGAAQKVLEHDLAAGNARLARVRDIVNGAVVIKRQDVDLGGGKLVLVQDDLRRGLARFHVQAARRVAISQNGEQVALAGIGSRHLDLTGTAGAVAGGGDRRMALVNGHRDSVVFCHTGHTRRRVILFQHPSEFFGYGCARAIDDGQVDGAGSSLKTECGQNRH